MYCNITLHKMKVIRQAFMCNFVIISNMFFNNFDFAYFPDEAQIIGSDETSKLF